MDFAVPLPGAALVKLRCFPHRFRAMGLNAGAQQADIERENTRAQMRKEFWDGLVVLASVFH